MPTLKTATGWGRARGGQPSVHRSGNPLGRDGPADLDVLWALGTAHVEGTGDQQDAWG